MSALKVRVVVHDLHFDIIYNRIAAHSEDYATPSNARRAARGIIKAMQNSDVVLETWMGRMGSKKVVREHFPAGGR